MMKIVEYSWTLTPEDRTWLVIECEEEGREKETGFGTEREARMYRDAACDLYCALRLTRHPRDKEALITRLAAKIGCLRQSATVKYGHDDIEDLA